MKREFLKELGLEENLIDKIMSEHGTTVNALKAENKTLTEEKGNLETQLGELNSNLEESTTSKEQFNSEIQELKTRNKSLETDLLKFRIARANNLPDELASRLQGEDEDSILKDAQTLSKIYKGAMPEAPLKDVEQPLNDDPYLELVRGLEKEN